MKKKNFRWDFDIYNEQKPSFSIDDSRVIEYEFINQGNSVVVVNDGLRIYPTFSGIQPSTFRGTINENENDTTIYRFKFEALDFRLFTFTFPGGGGSSVSVPFISDLDPGELFKQFNRILVITKVEVREAKERG